MHQVLSINSHGEISGLRMPANVGLDLRRFGKIKVERVSEIVLGDETQCYYVYFIAGPLKGEVLDTLIWNEAQGHDAKAPVGGTILGGHIYFEQYEDAVAAEVAVLNRFRLAGVF